MPRKFAPTNADYVPLLTAGPFGGLDTTTEPYYVAPTNFVDIMNLVPNAAYGGYVMAKGRKVFLASPLPGQCRGVYRFITTGDTEGYIFAVDIGVDSGYGALYYATPGGIPQVLTLPAGANLTFGQQYSFAVSQQWIFITNGVDTPLKVDQNLLVTYWGIVAPTTAPTLMASATPSTMVGTYNYSITFGTANQESSQGAVSAPITVTNLGIILTGIPVSSDPQVTERNIYRLGGSNGIWQLVYTIPDNTTTTYTDTKADTALGQDLTVFRDPPLPFTVIITHQERIWGFGSPSDPSILYYSNLNEPWGFNSETGNFPVGENSQNDIAVGLGTTGSVLACLKSNSLYGVFGNANSNFVVQFIEPTGCISQNSVWSAYGQTGWLSRQGAYVWTGSGFAQNISDGAYQQSNIKSALDGLMTSDLVVCTTFVTDRMVFYSFPTLNRTYFFDFRTNNWFSLGWACDQAYFDMNDEYPLIATNLQTVGQIDQWFADPGDFGNAITAYAVTGLTDSGSVNSTKVYRYILVQAPQAVATLAILTTVNVGALPYFDNYAVDMSTGGPVFQTSYPPSIKGNEIQVRLLVTSAEQVHIQKMTVMGYIDRYNIEPGSNG